MSMSGNIVSFTGFDGALTQEDLKGCIFSSQNSYESILHMMISQGKNCAMRVSERFPGAFTFDFRLRGVSHSFRFFIVKNSLEQFEVKASSNKEVKSLEETKIGSILLRSCDLLTAQQTGNPFFQLSEDLQLLLLPLSYSGEMDWASLIGQLKNLCIADAQVTINAESPFSSVSLDFLKPFPEKQPVFGVHPSLYGTVAAPPLAEAGSSVVSVFPYTPAEPDEATISTSTTPFTASVFHQSESALAAPLMPKPSKEKLSSSSCCIIS